MKFNGKELEYYIWIDGHKKYIYEVTEVEGIDPCNVAFVYEEKDGIKGSVYSCKLPKDLV